MVSLLYFAMPCNLSKFRELVKPKDSKLVYAVTRQSVVSVQFRVRDLCIPGDTLVTRGNQSQVPYVDKMMRCPSSEFSRVNRIIIFYYYYRLIIFYYYYFQFIIPYPRLILLFISLFIIPYHRLILLFIYLFIIPYPRLILLFIYLFIIYKVFITGSLKSFLLI